MALCHGFRNRAWALSALTLGVFARLQADPFVPQWAPWLSDQLVWQWPSKAVVIWYTPWQKCQSEKWWGLCTGIGLAPTESVEVQGALSVAKHTGTSVYADTAQLCGRLQLLDDVAGDPISLTSAVTVTFGTNDAVRAVAEFVPSNVNAEIHLAAGKEWAECEEWKLRCWLLGAVGAANQGRPWIRGSFHVDWQPLSSWQVKCSVEAIQTFGTQTCWGPVFPGYAEIRASWVDLQVSMAKVECLGGSLGLEARSRLWAKRAPTPWTLGGFLFNYSFSF
jgi:hypothetical protein